MFALLAAIALIPAGFTYEPVISARAAWVAQKPVTIYCASTDAAWQAELVALTDLPPSGQQIHGVTPVAGGDTAFIDSEGCATIRARIKGQIVLLPTLGAALDVLTVESLHMRGEVDDGQTACDAIRLLPRFLVAKWGFRNGSLPFTKLMRGAHSYLSRQPPQYHSAGC